MSTGTLLAQHHQAKHLVGESVFRKPDVLKKKMSCFRNHRLNLLAALNLSVHHSPWDLSRFCAVCLVASFHGRGVFPHPAVKHPVACHMAEANIAKAVMVRRSEDEGVLGEKKLIYIYLHQNHQTPSLSGFVGIQISHEFAMCYACFRFDVFNRSPSTLANVGEAPAAEEFVASAVWSLREREPGTVGIRWFWKDLGWFI